MTHRDPAEDLRRIAYLLERARQPSFRVKAFRTAAAGLDGLERDDLQARADAGTLRELPGVGATTAQVIAESLAGREPEYLAKQQAATSVPTAAAGAELRAALRGDCHTHSDWSDGGAPIAEMARTARDIGHEYLVLTDHSPRLRVANGLTADRLMRQLDVVAEVNQDLAPFRLLSGIEVDILDDGRLDQSDEMLARVDVVVASVHSKLRMPSEEMTARMVRAVANPHTDILGHCTGRLVEGERGTRPPSRFDAEIVFAACERFGVAVEINSRPERQDPPEDLMQLALDTGCLFSIDTDAHAPGQLEWQVLGCDRAADVGVPIDRVVDTWRAPELLAWCGDHASRP